MMRFRLGAVNASEPLSAASVQKNRTVPVMKRLEESKWMESWQDGLEVLEAGG